MKNILAIALIITLGVLTPQLATAQVCKPTPPPVVVTPPPTPSGGGSQRRRCVVLPSGQQFGFCKNKKTTNGDKKVIPFDNLQDIYILVNNILANQNTYKGIEK